MAINGSRRSRWPRSSTREPAAIPSVLENNAIVFVMFAVTGDSVMASSAG
ncbi:hypothetical protein FrEUN1fDRAFT_0862 [Parafrankia sp. EUN1f]|nr:hypothetical protein FrEUN1fDRAFT_0862 [Parafrankia sp. EUN1f]